MNEKALFGRTKIFSTVDRITADNVLKVLNASMEAHIENMRQEEYLYYYRRGVQPILQRQKSIRPEINNKVTCNNADQVVVFKNGYFLTAPPSYVSRSENEAVTEKVRQLNEYLYTSGKQDVDNEVVNWFHTVGVGCLLIEPNKENDDRKPVNVYTLDPRQAFVVYSRRPGNHPIMGVNIVVSEENKAVFDVFTKDAVYRCSGGFVGGSSKNVVASATALTIDEVLPNVIGEIPIVEYQFDDNRMGAFEQAVPIFNAINAIESNRVDGIEQFIQSLLLLVDVEIPDDITTRDISKAGMIQLKTSGDKKPVVQILSEQLDQTQTQMLIDNLDSQWHTMCGIPFMSQTNGGTSDNVGAVFMRSGYSIADTHARNTQDLFRKSNKQFTKIFLSILKRKVGLDISMADIDLNFVPGEVSNLLVKTQGAMNMMSLGLAPEIYLARSGISSDPITDIAKSQKYIDRLFESKGNKAEQSPDTGTE